jgi:FixJ family two-component response regulator
MGKLGVKPRIAIIDDDFSFREALIGLVRSLGYIPDGFSSASDFIKQACIDDYDCLLIDVQMPGMSGIDLLKHLSAEGKKFRANMISSFSDRNIRESAILHGASCFLVKPFGSDDLISALESAIGS